jgi:RNA polymerase sigma factor (sigma-70 family)
MTGPRPAELLRHLVTETAPDRDLLRRYAATRDGDAFAELVRRHGPVVLAASRRGVRHHHDADDVFQAVFLVLARRAGAIDRPELLGNWLYGVAVRVARHARRAAARRRVREVQGVDIPEPMAPTTPVLHDLGPLLDEELDALPALYRDAVVLCDLRGVSRADAAAQLGVPLGTLASRVDGGRKKLAARLVRRGVTLSAAAVLVEGRAVAMPDTLLKKTGEVVASWSAGGAVPTEVLRLAQGGLSMRGVLLGGLLALSLAAGVALATGQTDPPAPPQPPAPPVGHVDQPDAKPVPAMPVKLGAPKLVRKLDLRQKDRLTVVWSPAGDWLAVSGRASAENGRQGPDGLWPAEWMQLDLVPVADTKLMQGMARLSSGGRLVGFTSDGGHVLTETTEAGLVSGSQTLHLWTVAARPQDEPGPRFVRVTPGPVFDLPDGATAFAPATGPVVRFLVPEQTKGEVTGAEVRGLDTHDRKPLGPLAVVTGAFRVVRLSPDGARVLGVTADGRVEVYSAENGMKVWATGAPPRPSDKVISWEPRDASNFPTLVAFARDGTRVLAGRHTPAVLAGDTGKALPPLEGIEWVEGVAAGVSSDGRLAALSYLPAEDKGVKAGPKQFPLYGPGRPRLTVWDTATGKVVRSWQGNVSALAFHPTRPVLAVLEPHESGTRLGFWDFTAQP